VAVQNLSAYLNILDQQYRDIVQQITLLQYELDRYNKLRKIVDRASKNKIKGSVMLPIATDILVIADSIDFNRILVGIGGGLFAELDAENTLKIIDEKIQEIRDRIGDLTKTAERIRVQASSIVARIQQRTTEQKVPQNVKFTKDLDENLNVNDS